MDKIIISVKNDFDRCPGLRTHAITPGKSGEDFYHTVLNCKFYEAIKNGTHLIVDLDDTAGYPPSFIDESFGRLTYDFGKQIVAENLEIKSDEEEIWQSTIFDSVITKWEVRRNKGEYPEMSDSYSPDPWWHLDGNGNYNQISNYNGNK